MATKTTRKTTAKAKPKADAEEVVVDVATPRPTLKKKDIVAEAVSISGVKKKDARPAAEAAMQTLFKALADGKEVSFPPHGKIRIVRTKDMDGAKVITAKIRVSTSPAPIRAAAPLADADE